MKLRPLRDQVIIIAERSEEISKGGIVIPDTAKKKSWRGEVLAVGPGLFVDGAFVPTGVEVGQAVMFERYGCSEVDIDGTKYVITAAVNVLAVVET